MHGTIQYGLKRKRVIFTIEKKLDVLEKIDPTPPSQLVSSGSASVCVIATLAQSDYQSYTLLRLGGGAGWHVPPALLPVNSLHDFDPTSCSCPTSSTCNLLRKDVSVGLVSRT